MKDNNLKFIFKGQQNHAFENYVDYYIIKNKLDCKFKNGEYFKVCTKYETENSGIFFASMDKHEDIFDACLRNLKDLKKGNSYMCIRAACNNIGEVGLKAIDDYVEMVLKSKEESE